MTWFKPIFRLSIQMCAMPARRSSMRIASSETSALKRKADPPPKTTKRAKRLPDPVSEPVAIAPQVTEEVHVSENTVVPADELLTFSFEEARKHLIRADSRFEDLFDRLPCKPFQFPEQLDPFRSLATSILGQQISWLAARSITHKFIRLYDPSIPENRADYPSQAFFPTPQQVVGTEMARLRTAGLSARKAEYILDLSARFSDGRLSTDKLLKCTDEELAEMLLEVRGIGKWTVDMFALFSLRRADILPVGDLGVQRGLVRWALAQHSPTYSYMISPEKLPASDKKPEVTKDDDVLPSFSGDAPGIPSRVQAESASIPIPPTFTPSINRTLTRPTSTLVPLPEGLTAAELKSRLSGKKKVKGALLSPAHMEALTENWRPYRSIGVYYMWCLSDAE